MWKISPYLMAFGILMSGLLTDMSVKAQEQAPDLDQEAFFIQDLHKKTLSESVAYDWLKHLTKGIGGRLSGSPEAAAAVEYCRQVLDTLGFDTVFLQECRVPHWTRGETEQARVVNSTERGTFDLDVLSLGNAPGTPPNGLTAEIVEVHSLDEVEQLGRENIEGKIVFYNRPMDPTHLRTFTAYGSAVDQRVWGPARASEYGAIATLVRSMTVNVDDVPHTGVTVFRKGERAIPAFAVSTEDADLLSHLLDKEGHLRVFMQSDAAMLSRKKSYNVIAEKRGTTHPDEIILVGGHLDSWDVGEGAHDDGAGCVQSMEVLRILNMMDYEPKRTLRCVLFMNEENGMSGGITYANRTSDQGLFHLAALESDRGAFTPRGFTFDAQDDKLPAYMKEISPWSTLLEPYNLYFKTGGSGADVSRLKSQGGLLIGYLPDSQRYFDIHHAETDVLESVNKRELEMGIAAITSLIYLIDKYGLE